MTTPPLAVAALLSCALAWRAPSDRQRAIAAALVAFVAINVGRPLLDSWPSLYFGTGLAWYGVTSWTVEATLAPESPRTGQVFALLVAASSMAIRLGVAVELARASFALALAAQLLAALRFAWRGKWPADAAQWVAVILVISSIADAFGPWLFARPGSDWWLGRWISIVTWTLIAGVSSWRMLRRRRTGS